VIVCSCNVLSDRTIRHAAESGRCMARVSDVFEHLGCRPQCGRCAPTIRRLLRESIADDGLACPALVGDTDTLIAAE
jgi:bacterioferritin-associated ferredoxin